MIYIICAINMFPCWMFKPLPDSTKSSNGFAFLNKDIVKINPRCSLLWVNKPELIYRRKPFHKRLECFLNSTCMEVFRACDLYIWLRSGHNSYGFHTPVSRKGETVVRGPLLNQTVRIKLGFISATHALPLCCIRDWKSAQAVHLASPDPRPPTPPQHESWADISALRKRLKMPGWDVKTQFQSRTQVLLAIISS